MPIAEPPAVFRADDGAWVVSRHADVRAVLDDPRFVVPGAGAGGRPGTLAWLRETVCRFSEGEAHERRLGVVRAELERLDPATLGQEAARRTEAVLDRAAGATLDVMAPVARRVPVATLGDALGVDEESLAEYVPVAAAGYLTGLERPAAADAAVKVLTLLLGPGDGEVVANRIALLMQAYEATAGLVGLTLAGALRLPDPAKWPAADLVAETLRHDPPVRAMRRVTAERAELGGHTLEPGTAVRLDVAAANRDPAVFADPGRFDPARGEGAHLTFGAGRRPCPGGDQALWLAAGIVEVVLRRCRPAGDVEHTPGAGVPARLEVTCGLPHTTAGVGE
ncbi:MAG: cytochrome P450 [Actinoallomurus sp.]